MNHLKLLFALLLLTAPALLPAFMFSGNFATPEIRTQVLAIDRAYDRREYTDAWDLATAAIAEHPDSLEVVSTYILVGNSLDKLRAAIAEVDRLNGGPDSIASHHARAWAAGLWGNSREALVEIGKIRALTKTLPFEVRRVELLARRIDPKSNEKDVLNAYDAFVTEFPNIGLAHLSRLNAANSLSAGRGRIPQLIEAALAAAERTPQTWVMAASIKQDAFWFDARDALALIDRGLEEFPDHSELAVRRILYLRKLGRTQEALDYCLALHKKAPNHGDFLINAVGLLGDLGRFSEARELSKKLADLKYQPDLRAQAPVEEARNAWMGGNGEEAFRILSDFVAANPQLELPPQGRNLLYRLGMRKATDKVRIVPGVGFLEQRGNYCGPATVHMILDRWGKKLSQEDIAKHVYTGIAGTPPQVIHNFLKTVGFKSVEFEGDAETWKRLLDAGYPILWLQMMEQRGGHYRVVTGYDEALESWIMHDPNDYSWRYVGFDAVEDTWPLPSLRRSIAIFPADKSGDGVLAGLGPTPTLLATNWLLFIATGSNLFGGIWPALPVNMTFGLVLAWMVAMLLRRVTFPLRGLGKWRIVGVIGGAFFLLNLAVAVLRVGEAVSLLLGFTLALLTIVPLLLLIRIVRPWIADIFHPRETVGFCLVITAVWMSLSFVDRAPFEWMLPVAFFVIGIPVLIWPRLQIRRAERALAFLENPAARGKLARWGSSGAHYFGALTLELESLLRAGRLEELRRLAETLATELPPGSPEARAMELHALFAQALDRSAAESVAKLDAFCAQHRVPKDLATLARAARLYATARAASIAPNAAEVEAMLAALANLNVCHLSGMPATPHPEGRELAQTARMMMFELAPGQAQAARYGLAARVFKG